MTQSQLTDWYKTLNKEQQKKWDEWQAYQQ